MPSSVESSSESPLWKKIAGVAIGLACLSLLAAGIAEGNRRHLQGISGLSSGALNLQMGLEQLSASMNSIDLKVPYEVCNASSSWTRPTKADQLNKLRTLPYYQHDWESNTAQSVFQQFWTHQVFSFTRYGLSLRSGPVHFSGLWTLDSALWKCYNPEKIAQINAAKSGEIWLLMHRVVALRWANDRYLMVVEPVREGVQFIYFPRQEQQPNLPITIITQSGEELAVLVGD